MGENKSRQDRRENENQKNINRQSTNGISKIYYWIIGILFLILILLIIFIFSRSRDNVNIESDQNQDERIEQELSESDDNSEVGNEDEKNSSSNTQMASEEAAEDTEEQSPAESTEGEEENDEEDSTSEDEDIEEGESIEVNENLPHDTNYATDYSTGSADRLEIKERVMEVTGLGDDLIEVWVGNDGPGRVIATVSSRDQTEHYDVYLQYGEGNWHVRSYQRLSERP